MIDDGLVPVPAAAADRFGSVRVALDHASDRLLFPHVHTPEPLMRHVRDLATDVNPDRD